MTTQASLHLPTTATQVAPSPTPTPTPTTNPLLSAEEGMKKELDQALAAGQITKAQYDKAIKNLAGSVAGVAIPGSALAVEPPGAYGDAAKIPARAAGLGNINPISSVTDLIKALGNPNTWVRVAEVTVGLICVAVGVSAMTKANPVRHATKAAAKATVL